MRKVNYWLACFMATAAMTTTFTACSSDDDPDFNPPTVSVNTTNGEINLADGTTFELPVNITSEAGLKSIVVKDSEGNVWLEQTSFTNPNSVTSVTLDLSSCTETKLLLLTVTATANDGKTMSSTQPYSLNVNVPQLYVALNNVSTITDNATLNVTISRGIKALAKVKVYLNDVALPEISLAENAKDKKVLKSVALEGLEDNANAVKVEVYEEGQATASVTEYTQVMKISTDNFVFFVDGAAETFEVRRNEETGVPEFIAFTPEFTGEEAEAKWYYWNLKYDDTKSVVKEINVTYDDIKEGTMDQPSDKYEFSYTEYNELTGVKKNGADYITDVVYEGGVMTSYKINGETYTPKYATEGNVTTRVDCLDADMSGEAFAFTGNETPNPFYVSGLPAVIPGDVNGFPLQLVYSQYLFNQLGSVWNAGWKEYTDETFGIPYPAKAATVTRKDGRTQEFKFLYFE